MVIVNSDGEGNQRGTKLIIPDSSTLVSLTDPNPNSNPLPSFHIPSSSYSFHAAFPHTSDIEEKLEVAWTTNTYDHSGNNGSSMVSQRLQVTGVWDDVSYSMSAATMDTKFVRTRRPMVLVAFNPCCPCRHLVLFFFRVQIHSTFKFRIVWVRSSSCQFKLLILRMEVL